MHANRTIRRGREREREVHSNRESEQRGRVGEGVEIQLHPLLTERTRLHSDETEQPLEKLEETHTAEAQSNYMTNLKIVKFTNI